MLFLLLGCFAHYPLVSPTAPVATSTADPAQPPPPITFSPLEEKLESIFSVSTDADQRDRLSNLRELLHAMRAKDPVAQRRVYDYADAALKIEARAIPQTLPVDEGMDPIVVPIEEHAIIETPLTPAVPAPLPAPALTPSPLSPTALPPTELGSTALTPTSPIPAALTLLPPAPIPAAPTPADLLATARASVASGNYLVAIDTLAPLTSPEAAAFRKETVDAWARTEREAAGAAFITARAMPAGPDRTTALTTARDRLVAINQRFPDNNFAAAIADNIAKVNAELGP